MTPTETTTILRQFNEWLRGDRYDIAAPTTREMGEAIDAAIAMIERSREWWDSLIADLSAIDCVYRGDPSYAHDAYWLRERVMQMFEQRSRDGNQWRALFGENIQDGVVGFGDGPDAAMWAFDEAWREKLPPAPIGVVERKIKPLHELLHS